MMRSIVERESKKIPESATNALGREERNTLRIFQASTPAAGEVQIVNPASYEARLARIAHKGDEEHRKRERAVMSTVANLGPYRSVSLHSGIIRELEKLGKSLPHFRAVTDDVIGQIRLSRFTKTPLKITPILLDAPPGLGKSFFSERFAAALRTPIFRVAMDAAQTISELTGSDEHWSNTTPGVVFRALTEGKRGNPVILVDELDKATMNGNGQHPATPLHGLLEPLTAEKFTDLSAGVEMDASFVVWIATSNNKNHIEASILSRFNVYDITAPTHGDALRLASDIAQSMLSKHNLARRLKIDPNAVAQLASMSPREQGRVMRAAAVRALMRKSPVISREDFPSSAGAPLRRSIGFHARH